MGKLELYQFGPLLNQESASPFCVKARYAMRYKRVAFDTINATSPLQVRRLNPRAKLPVLIDDGLKIVDSSNIVRHLESRQPEPRLYPQEPRARAMALLFEDWRMNRFTGTWCTNDGRSGNSSGILARSCLLRCRRRYGRRSRSCSRVTRAASYGHRASVG